MDEPDVLEAFDVPFTSSVASGRPVPFTQDNIVPLVVDMYNTACLVHIALIFSLPSGKSSFDHETGLVFVLYSIRYK